MYTLSSPAAVKRLNNMNNMADMTLFHKLSQVERHKQCTLDHLERDRRSAVEFLHQVRQCRFESIFQESSNTDKDKTEEKAKVPARARLVQSAPVRRNKLPAANNPLTPRSSPNRIKSAVGQWRNIKKGRAEHDCRMVNTLCSTNPGDYPFCDRKLTKTIDDSSNHRPNDISPAQTLMDDPLKQRMQLFFNSLPRQSPNRTPWECLEKPRFSNRKTVI